MLATATRPEAARASAPAAAIDGLEVRRLITPTAVEIRRARRRLHRKSLVIAVAGAASYSGLLFVDWGVSFKVLFAVALVLSLTAAATSVMHDGNHASFSSSKLVNRLAGCTADVLGASSWIWRFKHNNLHHGNTNVVGVDSDIDQAPFARLASEQPWRPWHRFQHVYMWVLYGFLTLQWFLLSDFLDLRNRGVGEHRFPRPARTRDVVSITAGKALHATWAIGVPMLFHRWWVVVAFYCACSWVVGLLLATMFQLAHCVEEADFAASDAPRRAEDFVGHQMATTVDVRCRNPIARRALRWLMGGLDFQVEHHLAPRLPHTVYPLVAARLDAVCAEHDMTLRSHSSPWRAIRSHGRWLKQMGRRPAL